jgi:hypothetical protein
MSDDAVARLIHDAIAAAAQAPRPKNPQAYELARELEAIAEAFRSGHREPSPRARAMAQTIIDRAREINERRDPA